MALDAIVVIPARDEEARIAACLQALAAQTIVELRDDRRPRRLHRRHRAGDHARRRAPRTRRPRSSSGPGAGSGPARRLGMDLAAERLLAAGAPDGLIASTDADTRPAPSWLARQLAHVRAGARVVAGRVELDPAERRELPDGALRRRERDAAAATRARAPHRRRRRASPLRRRVARASRPPSTGRSAAWSRSARSRMRPSPLAWPRTAFRSCAPPTSRSTRRRDARAARGAGCRSTSRSRCGPSAAATTRPTSRSTA